MIDQSLDDSYRSPPATLATKEQLSLPLSENIFNLTFDTKGRFGLKKVDAECLDHAINYNNEIMAFLMEMKNTLKRHRVDFDQYRSGEINTRAMAELAAKRAGKNMIVNGDIHKINEFDFSDYKLEALEKVCLYQHRSTPDVISPHVYHFKQHHQERFSKYMNEVFIPRLDAGLSVDTGLSYENIFRL